MLKQSIKLLVFGLLALGLSLQTARADLQVFACEPEWAALAKSLGGDHLTIYTATTHQQDPHHIQARPSLIAKARRADLLICTGAELEIGWLPLLLRKSGNSKIQVGAPGHFIATDQVTLVGKPAVLDRSVGDVHAAGNPHIHLDPDRVLQVARGLTDTLVRLDSANQTSYQNGLEAFTADWQGNISRWRQQAAALKNKPIAAHHDGWPYLNDWLGLNQVALLEPRPGIPPSSTHLSGVLASLKRTPVDLVVYASYDDPRAARWLAEKTGIPAIELDASPTANETLTQWFDRLIKQLLMNQS